MMSRMVVKLAGIYCCENSNNSVVMKGCMGRKEFPESRKIRVNDRQTAQCLGLSEAGESLCIFQFVDHIEMGKTCKCIVVHDYDLKWSEKEPVTGSIMVDLIWVSAGQK